ncbi:MULTISPECIES: translation elongation factor Ts [unclassified Mycoplasma]|uniref:translation elongation factor Ts n=1 Tax=unclassified Mycoplasma TaxID=2683645 RepID=UPI000FDD3AE9
MEQIEKIKQLREMTHAGFLDCKKALESTKWDLDKAVEFLRKAGISKAAKKESAIAAEGVIAIISDDDKILMFEVNSQTDFVAQNPQFLEVVDEIGIALIKDANPTVETALKIKNADGQSVEEMITSLRATLGEKIALRRLVQIQKESGKSYGVYLHTNRKIGAIVVTQGGNDQIARNVAMHVASMNPAYLDAHSVPSKDLANLRHEISDSPVLKSKPDNIKEQIAEGMLKKKLAELTLVDQEFVMEKMPVQTYLKNHQAKAEAMYRMEVGQGMAHKSCDFVSEVQQQIKEHDKVDSSNKR